MSSNLALVFVPGAWHSASIWDKMTSILEAHQYKCTSVTLPSTSGSTSATFKDDVDAVRNAITAETTQGRNVVVVVHSYGGACGASAIKGLSKPKDDTPSSSSSGSKSGHVMGMVYMASGFGPTGMSFIEAMGGKPPPQWNPNYDTGYLEITADPKQMFYNDLPNDEAEYWLSKLTEQSLKPMMEKESGEHSYAGWMDVPIWYLLTTNDQAVPIPEFGQMMVKIARDAGADVTVREIESGHSPMLSKPKESADVVMEAVAAFTG